MTLQHQDIIKKAYAAFNARDIDTVLSTLHPNVRWANGWEGGFVTGHEEVRSYWTRQWKEINPLVEPVSMNEISTGQVAVEVHQVAKDLQGNVIFDGMVTHLYTLNNGVITRMEIEKP